jgi:hypothetical protein
MRHLRKYAERSRGFSWESWESGCFGSGNEPVPLPTPELNSELSKVKYHKKASYTISDNLHLRFFSF